MNRVAHWWRPALLLCVLAGVPLLSAQEPGAAKSADGKDSKDANKESDKDAKKDDPKDAKKDTKKDEKKDAKKDEPEKTEKMEKPAATVNYIKQGLFAGKINDVRESDKNFSIDMAAGKGKNVRLSFVVTDDAKIRTMSMPMVFDDRGNLKRPSRDEYLRAKGKDRKDQLLPGFEAEFSNLAQGQVVQVQAVTTKERALAAQKAARVRLVPGQPPPPPEDIMTNLILILQEPLKKPGQGK
jgi:hypothetical protein